MPILVPTRADGVVHGVSRAKLSRGGRNVLYCLSVPCRELVEWVRNDGPGREERARRRGVVFERVLFRVLPLPSGNGGAVISDDGI